MTTSDLTNEQLDDLILRKRDGWDDEDFTLPIEARKNYSTDPRYAMELLKEMIDTGNTIVIFKEGDKYTFDGEADKCVGVADTPERAIAEAWMEWVK